MGKCLVTKLQETVNNSSLPYFNGFRYILPAGNAPVTVSSGPSILRTYSAGDDASTTLAPVGSTVRIISNGYFKHPTNDTPVYQNSHVMTNESLAVVAIDQTKPVEFVVEGYSSYSPGGSFYQSTDLICKDVTRFKYCSRAKYLNLQCSEELIDFSEFMDGALFNAAELSAFVCANKLKSGTDITEFAPFTAANYLSVGNCGITGTIESLVNAWREAGRTAPVTDFVIGGNADLTFEGNSCESKWGHFTLSWTDNTISLTPNS